MYVWSCVLAAASLFVLDIIWIMTFMGNQYRGMVFNIQKDALIPNKYYAAGAYCLMIFGLIWFVMKNMDDDDGEKLKSAAINGFAFGITLYGVYNFTAAAVFKNWSPRVMTYDIIWGGFVFFISAYIGSLINKSN